jgi:AraC family transcriptional regulator of adaptative response/methylated-DNA-[protein]-cysteine methyltransferase
MAHWRSVDSPLGNILLVADEEGLRWLTFPDQRTPQDEAARAGKYLGMDVQPCGLGDGVATNNLDQAQEELATYFGGALKVFKTPVAPFGPEFHLRVWMELVKIPYGQTKSYGQIAKEIGHPDASRAVGAANGSNPISIVIPCHRVIGADGSLTGYGGGLWRKQRLLELEGALTPSLGIA